jgi:dTMP kinase
MKFIAFEGLDGSGKSSLIQGLVEALKSRSQPFVTTREPGGTPLAEELRELIIRTTHEAPVPRCELLLYQAGRAQHVEKLIRPALQEGKWVLSDRFAASSVAFQSGGRSIPQSDVDWLNHYATGGLQPDLYVLLDLPVEESEKRRLARTSATGQQLDRFEKEASEFHERVRQKYLEIAKRNSSQWLVLSSTEPTEELKNKFLNHLRNLKWLA